MEAPRPNQSVIRLHDRYYVLADSSVADQTRRVLKHADTFLITDRHGDIRPLGFEDHGLFHQESRFLSRLTLRLQGRSPLLLSSTVTEDNHFLVVGLTNPDCPEAPEGPLKHGTLYLERFIFLYEGAYYERLLTVNYGLEPVTFELTYEYDADFADIFEVRGVRPPERGERYVARVGEDMRVLGYHGCDGVERRTVLRFSPHPEQGDDRQVTHRVRLKPHQRTELHLVAACRIGDAAPVAASFAEARTTLRTEVRRRREHACHIETTNEQFNDWVNRSSADLYMMLTETPYGVYPYAGIPWYSTIFGRDGLITALEMLWVDPEIARGVLRYLAAHQATALDPERDAEPGKVLHEVRRGEMANMGWVPFGRYYGTVDATPLFIMVAGWYYERTADLDTMRELWPAVKAALTWIEEYGDCNDDGFLEYACQSPTGLTNQGWKDSFDSVFHADGRLATPPIALCEVQGYVYQARLQAARLAELMGETRLAERQRERAAELRSRFLSTFWCEDIGTYALAIDGTGQPCRVRSSNAGHTLFTGIADAEHARRLVDSLTDQSFHSGWGIRTVAGSQARYNPMSYHNGSVWPHDNALIAWGMSRYGFREAAVKVMTGLFDASLFLELHRLPELFCGFPRRRGEGPTLYPVACDPQAWASGAVFLLLQACLGMSFDAPNKRVLFNRPLLPAYLEEVTIRNLHVAGGVLDISFRRHAHDVAINVMRRRGDVEVIVTK